MGVDDLHPLDAAAAAYRRRAHMLGLTDVRPFQQSELDAWAAEDASSLPLRRGTRPPRQDGPPSGEPGADHQD